MKHRVRLILLIFAAVALILDSGTAGASAQKSMELCGKTLIPGLFPLFILSNLLVPQLGSSKLPGLSRLLGLPSGSEGIFLLGCCGGFPVGAACIAQAVNCGGISKKDGERMLGLCSFCGPSFLFGILGQLLGIQLAGLIFLIQLEGALLLGALWPGCSKHRFQSPKETVSLPEAMHRGIQSMLSVCAWVILAGVLTGYLRCWVFPHLSEEAGILLTGLTELTGGIFAVGGLSAHIQFLFCTIFACFGGISVLLQIAGLASGVGLAMSTCILQKLLHAVLGCLLAAMYLHIGMSALFLIPTLLLLKISVEISGKMVYNVGRKEGI